jgi:xylulokinase
MTVRVAYLGVDAGTSGCKAILLGGDGRVLASAWQGYPTRRRLDGEVSQRADDWLRAAARTIRTCAEAAPARIEALSVTAPAHAAVLVGDGGRPLSRVLLTFDGRATRIAAALRRAYGRAFFERSFVDLSPAWTLPQLVWLRQRLPEAWPRIRAVLIGKDYIRYRMTGELATDPTDAAGTAMYDPLAGRWLEVAREDTGLRPDQLPPVLPALSVGGRLTRNWAHRTGLPNGTPVAVGATDTAAELYSLGAVGDGAGLVKIASTGTVVCVSDQPHPHPGVLTYPHCLPGRWYTLAATNTAATAYAWLAAAVFDQQDPGTPDSFEAMDALARRVPPGAGGVLFLPFLDGERSPHWDRDLRAAFLGVAGGHGRAHLCRAVLEGVAFSLRSCRDLLAGLGLRVERPFLTGGGVRSSLWRSILVSVLGQAGCWMEPHGPALGAARLAAAAVDGGRPPAVIRRSTVTVRPRADWQARYSAVFDTYAEAVDALQATSHRLARAARED